MGSRILLVVLLLASTVVMAQKTSEASKTGKKQNKHAAEAEALVKTFFEHFHARDTTALREMMLEHTMTSIVSSKKTQVTKSTVSKFLKGLASIPEDREVREQILEYKVYSDGTMATVTTPYILYAGGQKSHVGTNVFILGRLNGEWKIVGVTDSRVLD